MVLITFLGALPFLLGFLALETPLNLEAQEHLCFPEGQTGERSNCLSLQYILVYSSLTAILTMNCTLSPL